MSARARRIQVLGLLVVAISALLPQYEARAVPTHETALLPLRAVPQEVPAAVLFDAARRDLREGRPGARLWEVRRWYPFGLVPLWGLALLGVALWPRVRAWVGGGLLALTLALAVFEACYLGVEYAPLLPWLFGRAEVLVAWGMVVLVLFARRRADRSLAAVESHVAAQALLGWLHLLTLPATQARPWLSQHKLGDVAAALGANFLPPFWFTLAGLLLVFLPTYLRRIPASSAVPTNPAFAPPPT